MDQRELVVRDIGEDGLIEIFAASQDSGDPSLLVVPNGDDAAAWRVPDGMVPVLSTDAVVESVHFERMWADPKLLGRKAIAVNLSDLAAMGSRASFVFLSVMLPPDLPLSFVRAMASGMHEICREHGVSILGGNVSRSPAPIVVSVTVVGHARPDVLARRSSARPGDGIFVTGSLGNARLGLRCLRVESEVGADGLRDRDRFAGLVDAQRNPSPRVEAGARLAEGRVVSAMCDLSDGLASDLQRILKASSLGAVLYRNRLPVSAELERYAAFHGLSAQEEAFWGGEDYELLFTSPRAAWARMPGLLRDLVDVTCIGHTISLDDQPSSSASNTRLFSVDSSQLRAPCLLEEGAQAEPIPLDGESARGFVHFSR